MFLCSGDWYKLQYRQCLFQWSKILNIIISYLYYYETQLWHYYKYYRNVCTKLMTRKLQLDKNDTSQNVLHYLILVSLFDHTWEGGTWREQNVGVNSPKDCRVFFKLFFKMRSTIVFKHFLAKSGKGFSSTWLRHPRIPWNPKGYKKYIYPNKNETMVFDKQVLCTSTDLQQINERKSA